MEDIKSLLVQKKSVAPMKIIRAKQGSNGKYYKSEFLVMSIGIGSVTAMGLTSSMRYASIRDIEIPKGIIDDTKTYYANFSNIRNIKSSDIVDVIGTVPDDVYYKIVNVVMLTMLGYYRLAIDDEGFEHFEIITPMVRFDNPLLMIMKGLYNPTTSDQEVSVTLPETTTETEEKPKEEENKPKRKSPQEVPEIDTDAAVNILEELRNEGAFTSNSTIDERINKIYRVFDSHNCYPKGMLCVSNAYNAMFYGKSLGVRKKQLTIDKSVFKLYLTLNRFDLEKKFPEIPPANIDDTKNKIVNIYNGYVNSNASISDAYDIAMHLKEIGITKKNDFINAFKEKAKELYNDEAEAILAGQALYNSVIISKNDYPDRRYTFEEKKRSAIKNTLVECFDKSNEVREILEGITEENANFYANDTLKWSNKGMDGTLDAVVLFSIEKIIGRTGEESFFVLKKENEFVRNYFYITPFDAILHRFTDPNVRAALCKIKTLSDLSSMSDEKKSQYIINGSDPDKLEKILDMYIVRACSSHLSRKFLNKAAELMGIDGNILIVAVNKCTRFDNVVLTRRTDEPADDTVADKSEEVKEEDITETPEITEIPATDSTNASKESEESILARFISAARKAVNENKIPLFTIGKYYNEFPKSVIFSERFIISFTSDAFDQVCKLAGIKPVDAKKNFADNNYFRGTPVRKNSHLTKISMPTVGSNETTSFNVYSFDRITFDIPYDRGIVNLDGFNQKIIEKEQEIISHNEKLSSKKKEEKLEKKRTEELAKTQFTAFVKAAMDNLETFKKVQYGVKYYDMPKGIVYYTDTIIGFDGYAFESICADANLKSSEFKKYASETNYLLHGSSGAARRISIPIFNGKAVFAYIYCFSKKIFDSTAEELNSVVKEKEVETPKEETPIVPEEKKEELPKQKDEPRPIPVGQMEGKKKPSKNKEEKPAVKINIKGDYVSRFIDTASSILADKSVPLYPFGAYLKEIPSNGAVYFGKDLVAFDKVIFERICNQAALPLKETQKALFDRGYFVETKHDAKYSYYSRYMLHVYGQRPQEINVFKLKSSCFDGMSFS